MMNVINFITDISSAIIVIAFALIILDWLYEAVKRRVLDFKNKRKENDV